MLMKRALALTGNRDDAEDLVQETFVRALCAMDTLDPAANHRAWLLRVLTNQFIDQCRRKKSRPTTHSIAPDIDICAPQPDAPPAWAHVTPEQLDAAIDTLEEEFRTVYVLRVRQGLSSEEVAARLGIPRSTVGTRMYRARSKLKALLLARKEDA